MLLSDLGAAVKSSGRAHGALVGVRAVKALQEGCTVWRGQGTPGTPIPGATCASGTRAAVSGWASGCARSYLECPLDLSVCLEVGAVGNTTGVHLLSGTYSEL